MTVRSHNRVAELHPILCILLVAVARSSSDSVMTSYVLPVLRMTSCFHTNNKRTSTAFCGIGMAVPVDVAAVHGRPLRPTGSLVRRAGLLGGSIRGASAGPGAPVVALAVRRLDSATAGDGAARVAVYFMLIGNCAAGTKSAIYDCLVF